MLVRMRCGVTAALRIGSKILRKKSECTVKRSRCRRKVLFSGPMRIDITGLEIIILAFLSSLKILERLLVMNYLDPI